MLEVDHLTFAYPPDTFYYHFTLETGQNLAILGPSGGGKSTLLDLLSGFITPTGGDIRWQGKSLLSLLPAERPLTTLFQSDNLFLHLNVHDNLALGLSTRLKLSPAQRDQLELVAVQLGLTGLMQRLPGQLSGGQHQRVALGRCLLRRRPLLLMDEPFSALDPQLRLELLGYLRSLCRDHRLTLVLVTHSPGDVPHIADQVAEVRGGRLEGCEPVQAWLARQRQPL